MYSGKSRRIRSSSRGSAEDRDLGVVWASRSAFLMTPDSTEARFPTRRAERTMARTTATTPPPINIIRRIVPIPTTLSIVRPPDSFEESIAKSGAYDKRNL